MCARKPTPPYSRSRSRFASAKVRLFRKPAKKHERKFKKITKNGCKRDNKGKNTPYLYYIDDNENENENDNEDEDGGCLEFRV